MSVALFFSFLFFFSSLFSLLFLFFFFSVSEARWSGDARAAGPRDSRAVAGGGRRARPAGEHGGRKWRRRKSGMGRRNV